MSLEFDTGLQDTKRKVEAILAFSPTATAVPGLKPDLRFKMHLHRDIMLGTGFYNTLVQDLAQDHELANAPPAMLSDVSLDDTHTKGKVPEPIKIRPVPVVNFLDSMDQSLADSVVGEALPEDMDRFRTYLSNRPLGIGLIAAPVSAPRNHRVL